jgi:GTP-binding protein
MYYSCEGTLQGFTANPKDFQPDHGRPKAVYAVLGILAVMLIFVTLGRHEGNKSSARALYVPQAIRGQAFGFPSVAPQQPHQLGHSHVKAIQAVVLDGANSESTGEKGLRRSQQQIQQKPKLKVKTAEFVTSAGRPNQFLTNPIPHFVFAGRSNVGKSSLINALTRKKGLAKTSQTPGKTRLVNYFIINDEFFFVDVPGYGYAQVSHTASNAWGNLINTYLMQTPYIATSYQLMDVRHDPSAQDMQMIEWLQYNEAPFKLVLTKGDKLSNNQLNSRLARFKKILNVERSDMIVTSATTGLGLKELLQHLYEEFVEMRGMIQEEEKDRQKAFGMGYGDDDDVHEDEEEEEYYESLE